MLSIHDILRTQNAPRGPRRSRTVPKKFGSDYIGLIGFKERAQIIAVPATPHSHWLQTRISQLRNWADGDGTNLTDGLRLATEMHRKTPKGALKRVWLLTDGLANRERFGVLDAADDAARQRININTIAFGEGGDTDADLLKKISNATHNGKFFRIAALRELTAALMTNGGRTKPGRHRSETTIFAIDLSASMNGAMEGRTKIEVVQEALLHLLHWKQRVFA